MQTKEETNLTSWDDHTDVKYGKEGTPVREEWEQEFEAFKLGVLLGEARVKLKMTQEEMLKKVRDKQI
jgi:HTH-type transcriptional regulator/antitoxin HipB